MVGMGPAAVVVTPGEALRPAASGFDAGVGTYVRFPPVPTRSAAPSEPEYAGGRMYDAARPLRGGVPPTRADAGRQEGATVCAAVVGAPSVKRPSGGGTSVVSVKSKVAREVDVRPGGVPRVGDAFLGRATRVTPRSVLVELVASGGKVLGSTHFRGVLRKEDVRDREQDALDLPLLFFPGDVLKGVILSLGDGRVLQLGTGPRGCGVVGKADGERLPHGVDGDD